MAPLQPHLPQRLTAEARGIPLLCINVVVSLLLSGRIPQCSSRKGFRILGCSISVALSLPNFGVLNPMASLGELCRLSCVGKSTSELISAFPTNTLRLPYSR